MTSAGWITRDVLITVKAYPNPSSKYGETVCVAGVTREEGWIRLYPVTFRDLPDPLKFRKYQWVSVRLKKHQSDNRPESYRPDLTSLRPGEFVSAKDGWKRRKGLLLPTLSASMCEIQRLQLTSGKSLGMFRPASVEDFIIEDLEQEWDARRREILGQGMFFSRRTKALERIPYRFMYRYRCADPHCKGYKQSIVDWEIAELYRNVRGKRRAPEKIKELIRHKFFDELCSRHRETHFFVGNMAKHTRTFLVLGVFYPRASKEGASESRTLFG